MWTFPLFRKAPIIESANTSGAPGLSTGIPVPADISPAGCVFGIANHPPYELWRFDTSTGEYALLDRPLERFYPEWRYPA